MRQLIILFICSVLIIAANATENNGNRHKLIGGFGAPIFLTHYDNSQIELIINNKSTKSIKISYPKKLYNLAHKVSTKIQENSSIPLTLQEIDPVDTAATKYRHDAVIIVCYF
jgi:hypothetical protein